MVRVVEFVDSGIWETAEGRLFVSSFWTRVLGSWCGVYRGVHYVYVLTFLECKLHYI